jgi:hypothetical protein
MEQGSYEKIRQKTKGNLRPPEPSPAAWAGLESGLDPRRNVSILLNLQGGSAASRRRFPAAEAGQSRQTIVVFFCVQKRVFDKKEKIRRSDGELGAGAARAPGRLHLPALGLWSTTASDWAVVPCLAGT